MKYRNRDIEKAVKSASRQFPALIVTGPRQSGKTTLLKHLFSDTHTYVSLDDPDIRLMAIEEAKLFLENFPPPVIIDEVQYAPDLFSYLKIAIDENRSKRGQFLLTGSQSFPLLSEASETLAGRIAIFTLLSFSIKEQKRSVSLYNLKQIALNGGFPEPLFDKKLDYRVWFKNYVQTYLERDVRQIKQVGSLTDFQKFMSFLAYLNGQVLNLSSISRDLGVAVNTLKSWISILEASHQIILIRPFFKNVGKRIVKSPKIYFLDLGMVCFLNNIFEKEQVFTGPLAGVLFENLVLAEIVRYFYNKGALPNIYWWRTSTGDEVDFVVEVGGKLIPIEVKITGKANREIVRNLELFCSLFGADVKTGILVSMVGERFKMGEKVEILPIKEFLDDRFLSSCFGF